MALNPVNFETKVVDLAVPVDLASDPEIVVYDNPHGHYVSVQNTGKVDVHFRETVDRPNPADTAHVLQSGAGAVILLVRSPFWFWTESGGQITVSPGAAAPVYQTSG